MNGTVFDIKRFAVHDGAGIRSTLFLKGCPLRCPWCQNPEGLRRQIQLWHKPTSCVHCGTCVQACPKNAVTLEERVHIDAALCDACGRCVEACPAAAMELDGWEISAEAAAELLLRDRPFFGATGGVTLSGGEMLTQPEFAGEVLRLCHEADVSTAVETCLYAPWETVDALRPVVDHFLIDIKYLDAETHRTVIGVPNERILDNYARLVQAGADVLVRTPLIPGYTATEENIRAIARFVANTDPKGKYELLNFNPLCRSKYAALEQAYPVEGAALSVQEMERFYEILKQEGVPNIVKES